jgi:hypothetical protein
MTASSLSLNPIFSSQLGDVEPLFTAADGCKSSCLLFLFSNCKLQSGLNLRPLSQGERISAPLIAQTCGLLITKCKQIALEKVVNLYVPHDIRHRGCGKV